MEWRGIPLMVDITVPARGDRQLRGSTEAVCDEDEPRGTVYILESVPRLPVFPRRRVEWRGALARPENTPRRTAVG